MVNNIQVIGGEMSNEEILEYINYAAKAHPLTHLYAIEIVDEEYVDLIYRAPPFERIRRITGYLVGTLDRWNDAKRNEEHDRVKHGLDITDEDKFEE